MLLVPITQPCHHIMYEILSLVFVCSDSSISFQGTVSCAFICNIDLADDQASSDVCHDQLPLDYLQHSDDQASSDMCHDQPSSNYRQHSGHQASSDICHDQPPSDYHQHSDDQASSNMCHDQLPSDYHQHSEL